MKKQQLALLLKKKRPRSASSPHDREEGSLKTTNNRREGTTPLDVPPHNSPISVCVLAGHGRTPWLFGFLAFHTVLIMHTSEEPLSSFVGPFLSERVRNFDHSSQTKTEQNEWAGGGKSQRGGFSDNTNGIEYVAVARGVAYQGCFVQEVVFCDTSTTSVSTNQLTLSS